MEEKQFFYVTFSWLESSAWGLSILRNGAMTIDIQPLDFLERINRSMYTYVNQKGRTKYYHPKHKYVLLDWKSISMDDYIAAGHAETRNGTLIKEVRDNIMLSFNRLPEGFD
jgi:hypothetical protein